MQFDAKAMQEIIKQDDATLWRTVRAIAERYGVPLPEGTPPAADMARLRAILGTKGAGDVRDAMEVLRRVKGGR